MYISRSPTPYCSNLQLPRHINCSTVIIMADRQLLITQAVSDMMHKPGSFVGVTHQPLVLVKHWQDLLLVLCHHCLCILQRGALRSHLDRAAPHFTLMEDEHYGPASKLCAAHSGAEVQLLSTLERHSARILSPVGFVPP